MKSGILIIHQGALGDLILTLTAVKRGLCQKPSGIFCRAAFIPLIRHFDIAEHAWSVEDRTFSELFTDAASPRHSSLLSQFSKILIFSNSSILSENIKRLVPTARVHRIPPRPLPDQRIHVVDFLVQHIDKLFFYNKSARHEKKFLTPRNSPSIKGRILIHPGSGSPKKNWPIENFVQLHRLLSEQKIGSKWVVGPAESKKADELKSIGFTEHDIHSNDDLIQFCRRLKDTDLFIGNDSGLNHLAAYLGTPVITIFGPSDPVRWQPVGPDVIIVTPQTDCIPCLEHRHPGCHRPECFAGITAVTVIEKLKSRCWI
jgi:heptosyltransferase III